MKSNDIRVYFCHNAAQSGNAPAALAQFKQTPGLTLEAVPCGGRIDPRYLLKAFESGAQAVAVLACCSGHCRLLEGNLRARRRVFAVRELLAEAGIDPEAAQIFLPASCDEDALDAVLQQVSQFVTSSQTPAQCNGVRV